MNALASRFVEESSLELHSFLCNALAEAVEPRLRELDNKDGLGENRAGRIPSHSSGTQGGWSIKGPPHKWRYCVLKPHEEGAPAEAVTPRAASASSDEILRSLQDELFPSTAFRAWIAIVSRLLPVQYSVEARRFRPGLDYTLATSEEKEARLDVVLGLTPMPKEPEAEAPGVGKWSREQQPKGWQAAEWGGWEVGVPTLITFISQADIYICSATWHPITKKMILPFTALVVTKRPSKRPLLTATGLSLVTGMDLDHPQAVAHPQAAPAALAMRGMEKN